MPKFCDASIENFDEVVETVFHQNRKHLLHMNKHLAKKLSLRNRICNIGNFVLQNCVFPYSDP